MTAEFQWQLAGRCYKLGHNVPHPGGVVPNRIIVGRHFDAKDIIPHLFEETDPGFHMRCRPGDIIVAGRNFGMGPKMNGYIAMQALGLGLVCESMPFLGYRAAAQRLGFSYEGTFRQAVVHKGRNRDTAWYSVTDSEWPALRIAHEQWLAPENFDAQGRQQLRLSALTAPLLQARG